MNKRNTRIHYMYRDASNYKAHGEVIISGELKQEGLDAIIKTLDDGEHFIPAQVGMPELQSTLTSFPSEDDHVWHELEPECFHLTDEDPTTNHDINDVNDLIERFTSIKKWDVSSAIKRLNIT